MMHRPLTGKPFFKASLTSGSKRLRFSQAISLIWLLALLAGCSPLTPPDALAPSLAPAMAGTPAIAPATSAPTAPPATPPSATPTATARPTATQLPSPTLVPAAVATLEPTPTLAPLTRAERQEIFDQLWQAVDRRYVYKDFHGVDWPAARARYAPLAQDAETPEQFYQVLRAMIGLLGDDHSHFESPQEVREQEARADGALTYGGVGVTIRSDPGGGLITRLAQSGPAAQAGLHPRDLIVAIGGIPFTDTLAFGPSGPEGAVRGVPGTAVRLTVRSPGDAAHDVVLTRQIIPSDAFPPVSGQRLPGTQVGLLTIDTFERQDLAKQVRDRLAALLAGGQLSGLIIDLRDNSGGFVNVMLDTLAIFIDGGTIGTTSGRQSSEPLEIPGGQAVPELAGLPIVALTSADTVSAAEMFAAGLRVRGRARLVGTATAGNTENLLPHDFSDGSRLWLAELAYRLPDRSLLEGIGLAPDRVVVAEWWRFAPADDPQIQAALEELRPALARRSAQSRMRGD